jgi:hypothetical protein
MPGSSNVPGVMAFRGMPGGMRQVAPMAKLSAAILRRDPGCEGPACAMRDVQLIVDPLVFPQHGVARVPALAMIPGDPTLPIASATRRPRAHIGSGDAAFPGFSRNMAASAARRRYAMLCSSGTPVSAPGMNWKTCRCGRRSAGAGWRGPPSS